MASQITEALEQNNTTAGKLAAMIGVAERQAARIAALEKALEPFAACADTFLDDHKHYMAKARKPGDKCMIRVGVDDLLEAARVKLEKQGDPEKQADEYLESEAEHYTHYFEEKPDAARGAK